MRRKRITAGAVRSDLQALIDDLVEIHEKLGRVDAARLPKDWLPEVMRSIRWSRCVTQVLLMQLRMVLPDQ